MQSTTEPTVSVVIPAFNAAWCIRHAIDSVLAQSFPDFELIVVDDGSTDDTSEILRSYGDALLVVSQPNGGMSSARNAGIRNARGRYLAFLDADDRWLPAKLERQVALLDNRPELAFCAATATLEAPDGQVVGAWACQGNGTASVTEVFAAHALIAGGASSVLARRELVQALGGFDETLFGAEDTDLWIRLAAHGGFACIPEALVVVLKRPGSVSRNRKRMRAGALAMTRKNRHLLPANKRGAYWRALYAGTLCDYAKWACREGDRGAALADLARALMLAPLSHGRLVAGITLALITGARL